MTKRQEQAIETRKALIEAADRVISRMGPDSFSVEDITAEAGVSKGTFYTYFERKEEILEELAYPVFDRILSESISMDGDAADRLSRFLTSSIELIRDRGINMCRGWIRSLTLPDNVKSKRKLEYDREAVEKILSASDCVNDPETVSVILREYYGIVFCWCITDGTSDPVGEMEVFCNGPLRDLVGKGGNIHGSC
ncbi:MAG: TetR/AcrR family transcriptional regulator [Candidatus Methanomethylophilaceae archaeon]|nr:TetR/AcrR family transcriptional regulator [Candidatus Methanomethylophilaceae archaeon]